MKKFLCLISLLFVATCSVLFSSPSAFAQSDEDNRFLLLYFKEQDLVVESPTRSKKPVSTVAENTTVITSEEIKLMNAHTVADVLNNVTGVQIFLTGAPGSLATASIQGSESRHVAVFMDGIPLNNVSDNVVDLGSITVQNIERIEIIKGPASSAWGSSLGGVINIITKSGKTDGASGVVSASYGEKNTGDFRLETSGKEDRLGYYLTAGRLQTNGFRPHNDFSGNNAFAKINYALTNSTQVLLSAGFDKLDRGIGDFPDFGIFINDNFERISTLLSVKSTLNRETDLTVSFWRLTQHDETHNLLDSTGAEISKSTYDDKGSGMSAKLNWKHQEHNVVIGADVDSKDLESDSIADNDHALRKSAFYVNDTLSFHRFSVTPGLRADETNTNGGMTSPSLGITYKLTDNTLLRAFGARGFSIPPLASTFINSNSGFYVSNPDLTMEQVTSYQAGVETTVIPNVWCKIDVYRHNITDALTLVSTTTSGPPFKYVNGDGREKREGLEIEIKTKPFFNTVLLAGAAFMTATDMNTDRTISTVPQRTYDAALQYDNNSFKALLKGHYIYWNSPDTPDQGKYNSMIFDLDATKTVYNQDNKAIDLFADVHNIFNGDQYRFTEYKNPRRWIEAGIRYSF